MEIKKILQLYKGLRFSVAVLELNRPICKNQKNLQYIIFLLHNPHLLLSKKLLLAYNILSTQLDKVRIKVFSNKKELRPKPNIAGYKSLYL